MSLEDFNSLMVGVSLLTVTLAILTLLVGLFYYGRRLSERVASLDSQWTAFQGRLSEQT